MKRIAISLVVVIFPCSAYACGWPTYELPPKASWTISLGNAFVALLFSAGFLHWRWPLVETGRLRIFRCAGANFSQACIGILALMISWAIPRSVLQQVSRSAWKGSTVPLYVDPRFWLVSLILLSALMVILKHHSMKRFLAMVTFSLIGILGISAVAFAGFDSLYFPFVLDDPFGRLMNP